MLGQQINTDDPPISALETHIHQLQTTFTQIWQKMKVPEEHLPQNVVIWGTDYGSQALASDTLSNAIKSRIFFTYRSGFEPIVRADTGPGPLSFLGSMLFNAIPNTTVAGVLDNQHFTTDVGWGCMIRTSQSLLANALQSTHLGHEYHYDGPDVKSERIVALFADEYNAPFSLHNFIRVASESPLQVKPGEWFGPSAASLSIQRLCERYSMNTDAKIQVLISESCDLYDTDLDAHFANDGPPLLILLPIRLGIEKVNAYYHPSLFQILATKQSVGIAGGKPSSSYYFFGYQDAELLYLDPHNLQAASGEISTYHTSKCRSLPISALDPSMLIGIALSNLEDYFELRAQLAKTNKIVHFHKGPKRQKSPAGEEYVKVTIPELEGELVDDFVNVSDQISDGEGGVEDDPAKVEDSINYAVPDPIDSSISKYDVVGHYEGA